MADDPAAAGAADPLEAGVRAFIDDVMANTARKRSGTARLSRQAARRVAEEVRAPWRVGGPQMASVRELAAPVGDHELKVRIYDPTGAKLNGALLYLHGGGWALFSLDTHDRLMREYAERSGLTVIGVDYSLAPEAKFPTALRGSRRGARLARPRRPGFGGRSGAGGGRRRFRRREPGAGRVPAPARRGGGPRKAARAMLLNYGVFQVAISKAPSPWRGTAVPDSC